MSIEKAKGLSEFYQQVADGGEMQILYKNRWSKAESGPDLDYSPEYWRVVMPPKVTPVDMSVLVGSGIDCEFWDEGELKILGALNGFEKSSVTTRNYYIDMTGTLFELCKPRMGYWFSAMNFKDADKLVKELRAAGFAGEQTYTTGPTIEFRITGIADDRCWPWEQGNE